MLEDQPGEVVMQDNDVAPLNKQPLLSWFMKKGAKGSPTPRKTEAEMNEDIKKEQ